MKRKVLALFLVLSLLVTTVLGMSSETKISAAGTTMGIADTDLLARQRAIWMDSTRPIEERVEALLSAMTLEEKAAQMAQPEQNSNITPELAKEYGIGSVLSGGGSAPKAGNTAKDWADRVNAYKQAVLNSRLGIPLIYGVDGVHGHNNVSDTVIFPHNIGLGASRDTALIEEVGETAAKEIRATGIQWTFAPTLGVVYNERWGRFYESFGENADMVANMGAAYVKGFQGTGDDLFSGNKVAATAKHYIGEGQVAGGINQGNVELSEEDFDQLLVNDGLLKPYEEAIKAGARTVMVSYNSVNGLKCHGNYHLITEILKGEKTTENPLGLGFTGFVVSDYNGIHQLPGNYTKQVADSINAGIDMFMEPNDSLKFIDAVTQNYNNGDVSIERINDAVSRILRVKFEMGLFEEEINNNYEQHLLEELGSVEHRLVARKAVSQSLTLLKNDVVVGTGKTAMELLDDAKNILVAGYKANDIGAGCGGWTITWQGMLDASNGSGGKKITSGTTILEGMREVAGGNAQITYNSRGKVLAGSDVAVVVVGETPYAESNGDRLESELVLPDAELSVIRTAIESAGDIPIILVLTTGRPVAIADVIDDVDAVVEAWLPGTEGAGVADVLIGEKEFNGTLPVTWTWYPQDLTKKFTDNSKVLFPFGTGLKKDGTSIITGGQTSIPSERPEKPETNEEKILKRDGAIDIAAYDGKLEAEYANPTSGALSSYNIAMGSEMDPVLGKVGFAEWTAKSWGNTKWLAYIRQAGTYKVTFKAKVSETPKNLAFALESYTGQGDTSAKSGAPSFLTNSGYEEFVNSMNIIIDKPGKYVIKLMDGADPPVGKFKLDYVEFECTNPVGEYDSSQDEISEEPEDDTPLPSKGSTIVNDGVEVYMTSSEKSGDMSWYKYPTKMANQMTKKQSLDITSVDDQDMTTITINPDKTYQKLLGIGTSLEESTINNLIQLKPEMQEEFLRKLVDPNQAGMTLFRITIGTSDFTSKKFYTYYNGRTLTNENGIYNSDSKTYEPDWYNTTGNGFSIEKDREYEIIDTVKNVMELAKEYGVEDEVKFFASSWTPPGWMKTETSASKSYKDNDLLLKGGSLKSEYIDDLAMYYTRYLEEYAKEGIDIHAITLQNEPMLEINYPSCAMTGEQEGKLAVEIKKTVAASDILNAEQKAVKLWAFDHNPSEAYSYVQKILSVEGANEALDGIAFHDYSGSLSNMQNVLDQLLNKGEKKDQTVHLTERSVWGTTGANSIITYLRNSAVSYNSWVTMLDSNVGVHQWVGTPDPTMFARAAGSDNDYWAMPEYYIYGQFSRFIRPGYVRVDSINGNANSNVTNVVFKDPETGKLIAVVVNATAKRQNFKIVSKGTQIIGALPAGNIATYIWEPTDNLHNEIGDAFPATEYSDASVGIVKGEEEGGSYITSSTTEDYADYIVNIPKSGLYNITFEERPTEDGQSIQVLQNGIKVTDISATKTWNQAKVKVQGAINFATAGMQSVRIKMTPGVKLYTISLKETKEIHNVPGKMNANDYIKLNGSATIENGNQIGNLSWWSTIYYNISVPADDDYEFTISAARETTSEPVGFWLKLVNSETYDSYGDILTRGNGDVFGGVNNFNVSGTWDNFVETSGTIRLTEGEHVIGISTAAPINIKWISIGSKLETITPESLIEGEEDGKSITVHAVGGKFAKEDFVDNELSEIITGSSIQMEAQMPEVTESTIPIENITSVVTGSAIQFINLPTGVSGSAIWVSDTTVEIILSGNRILDYDTDKIVEVVLPVRQGEDGTGKVYPCSAEFIIRAVKDAESLVIPDQNFGAPGKLGEEKAFTIIIDGGTFNVDSLHNISIKGGATAYYTLKEIIYIDESTIQIVCNYNRSFYKSEELIVEIPTLAYADSKGKGLLSALITCVPATGLPDDIFVISSTQSAVLTEDKAYAKNGSMFDNVETGNYIDYFLDVEEAGTYVVTYTLNTLTTNGTSYANAFEVNRGVPGSPYSTNSYKQVSIPGLWTGSPVRLRHTIELEEGQQTLEFKAKSDGFKISEIQLTPISITQISLSKGEKTNIMAHDFYEVHNSHAIIDGIIEYVVDGSYFDYAVDVEKEGIYTFSANYASESSKNIQFKLQRIAESGKPYDLGALDIKGTGSWTKYEDSNELELRLPAGKYNLRLIVLGDGANLKQYTIGYKQEISIPVTQIQLSDTNLSLYVGDKKTINAVVIPNNSTVNQVLWKSNNEVVAIVDQNGTVTAVGKGTTTITATVDSVSSICTVIVTEKPVNHSDGQGDGNDSYEVDKVEPIIQIEYTKDKDGAVIGAVATIVLKINGISMNDKNTVLEVILPQHAIDTAKKENISNKPLSINIKLPTQELLKQLSRDSENITVNLKMPNMLEEDTNLIKTILLEKDVLTEAKKLKKNLTIIISNNSGKELYSWTFNGDILNNSKRNITNMNLHTIIQSVDSLTGNQADIKTLISKDKNNKTNDGIKGINLSLTHNGLLPASSLIKVYVTGDSTKTGMKEGTTVYLYRYNPKTKKLEILPNNKYVVDMEGYVTANITTCSDYVILPEKSLSSNTTSLLSGIMISPKLKTLYIKGTTRKAVTLKTILPATLTKVKTFSKNNKDLAVEEVKFTFKSSDSKIAIVSSTGKVIGKKVGKTTITITATLLDGTKKTYKTIITVK